MDGCHSCQTTNSVTVKALNETPNADQENKSSTVAKMGDRLATTDMRRKVAWLLCAFPWGGG